MREAVIRIVNQDHACDCPALAMDDNIEVPQTLVLNVKIDEEADMRAAVQRQAG